MNTSAAWAWAAWGKHPVVKDYIRFGTETPAAGALYRWVEEGFSKVPVSMNLHSWRFFARGTQPRELVCGLLRDSFDGAGRPFPFLIVGAGRLEGWENHWVYLPEILGGLWERLEFLGTRRVFDLEELKADVSRLPSPVFTKQWQPADVPEGDGSLIDAYEGMVSMGLKGAGDHGSEIVQGLKTVKTRSLSVPDAVFIGGLPEQSYLVAFTRFLNDSDFLHLWTMGNR